jgi:hypothetical protein
MGYLASRIVIPMMYAQREEYWLGTASSVNDLRPVKRQTVATQYPIMKFKSFDAPETVS